jgi:hypothetical protein
MDQCCNRVQSRKGITIMPHVELPYISCVRQTPPHPHMRNSTESGVLAHDYAAAVKPSSWWGRGRRHPGCWRSQPRACSKDNDTTISCPDVDVQHNPAATACGLQHMLVLNIQRAMAT